MRFRCGFSDFKTKLDANALFVTFTHRTIRYDVNARVTSAAYYSQLSKHSHLQRVPCVDKTRTNMSRLVANTSHPVNNHYNSNPDTFWTNLVYSTEFLTMVISPWLGFWWSLFQSISQVYFYWHAWAWILTVSFTIILYIDTGWGLFCLGHWNLSVI